MKKTAAALGAAVLLITGLAAGAPAASAATPYCGITWGSLAKADPDMSDAAVSGLRAGRHDCFDRLVVDLAGKVQGYRVAYVDQVVQDGSGLPVSVAGGARLSVIVTAPGYLAGADPVNLVDVSGFSTFRQVAWAGSFEGQTTFGLGVRARLPFRVFILDGPGYGSRLVVDVAHRW